jgi:hypothetical protein
MELESPFTTSGTHRFLPLQRRQNPVPTRCLKCIRLSCGAGKIGVFMMRSGTRKVLVVEPARRTSARSGSFFSGECRAKANGWAGCRPEFEPPRFGGGVHRNIVSNFGKIPAATSGSTRSEPAAGLAADAVLASFAANCWRAPESGRHPTDRSAPARCLLVELLTSGGGSVASADLVG